MPNLCGVNQKLFAEVLQQVKKTGDDRRASVTPDRNAEVSQWVRVMWVRVMRVRVMWVGSSDSFCR